MDVTRVSSQVRKLISSLGACTSQGPPGPGNQAIHRIRVLTKKLRAWLRLRRPELPGKRWRRLDYELRDLARQFSSARDREVLYQTLARLRECSNVNGIEDATLSVESVLQQKLPHMDYPQFLRAPDARLMRRLRKLQRVTPLPETLCKGLLHTQKKALHHGSYAYAGKNDFERLHSLRKWLKYLVYQLEMLYPAAERPGIYRRLQRMGDHLGSIHDLVVLRKTLADVLPEDHHKELAQIVNAADIELEQLVEKTGRSFRKLRLGKPLCNVRKIRAHKL